jgi:hypothetical protein
MENLEEKRWYISKALKNPRRGSLRRLEEDLTCLVSQALRYIIAHLNDFMLGIMTKRDSKTSRGAPTLLEK